MYRLNIPLCLFALLLLASVNVAQDAPQPQPEPDPAIELNRLFKQKDRQWTHRILTWSRGEATYVENETSTIVSIDVEGWVDVKLVSDRAEGVGTSTSTFNANTVETKFKWYADVNLPVETIDTGFSEFECRKHRETVNGLQVTTWVSTEYHPLIVKQTALGPDSSVIRTLSDFQSQKTDPYLLYRKIGRSWTTRNTVELEGMDAMVTYNRTTVTKLSDDSVTCNMEMLDADMKPMAGVGATEYEIELTTSDDMAVYAEYAMGDQPKHEKKEIGIGEFDCYMTSYGDTMTWTSTQWPGLAVYMETDMMVMELIEFDLGHDELKFYRTVGNYYETRTTTGDVVTSNRHEVTSVEDGKAIVTQTVYGAEGDVLTTTTYTETLETDDGDEEADRELAMPYDGQEEGWITTDGGSFAAIRTELDVEGMASTVWQWNGITVKMVSTTIGPGAGKTTTDVMTDYHIE